MRNFLLISTPLSMFFTLQTMERQLEAIYLTKHTQTTVQTHDMVEHINSLLNKKYMISSTTLDTIADYFMDISPLTSRCLPEQTATDILTMVTNCYQKMEPTSDCVEQLYTKNNIFKNAIDYFSHMAFQNIQDANCITLSTLENPALQQPSPQLNMFCYALKKCILDKAMKKIDYSYEIQLIGYPNCPIDCFQCCPLQDLVATGIPDAHLIEVWNLKSATKFLQVPIKNTLKNITLTSDGSYLIVCEETATQPNITHVVGWDLSTRTAAWSLEQPGMVYCILDTSNALQKIIALFMHSYTDGIWKLNQHLWSIQENTPHFLGIIDDVQPNDNNKFTKNPYNTLILNFDNKYTIKPPRYYNRDKQSTLFVTKQNCPALYLCEQAIKNNKHRTTLEQIKNSQAYQALTDYEKNMIEQKITQKTVELTALKQHQKNKTDATRLTLTYK